MVNKKSVKACLDNMGILAGMPKTTRHVSTRKTRKVPTHPLALQNLGHYLYWTEVPETTPVKIDDLEGISSELPNTGYDDMIVDLVNRIPDSPKSLIIDLGCEYGTKGGGFLASVKPNARVLLVNKKTWNNSTDGSNHEFMFDKDRRFYKYDLRFSRGKDLLSEPNLAKRVQGIYHSNGLTNVTYHEVTVTNENYESIFREHVLGKDLFLIGNHAPAGLPFIMANMFKKFHAEGMYLIPSAPEKIPRNNFSWEIIRANLGLSEEETNGYFKSAFHQEAYDSNDLSEYTSKYGYDNAHEKRIGDAIKLGMAFSLAVEVGGELQERVGVSHRHKFRGTKDSTSTYNGPSFCVSI